jgi:hypothetical protein
MEQSQSKSSAWKPSQWIGAVVAVALVVFAITFFRNYTVDSDTPTGKTTPVPTPGGPELEFAARVFPGPGPEGTPGAVPTEFGKRGMHAFWFENPNKEPVTVGLNRKTCKCTNVELFVLNEDWKKRRNELEKASTDDQIWSDLAAAIPPVGLLDKENSGKVPAGAEGCVRLTWKAEQIGPRILGAELWQGNSEGPSQKLEVNVHVVNAISVDEPQQTTGVLTQSELPRTVVFRCYSATRNHFKVTVAPINSRWKPEEDPFAVELTELKAEELKELQEDKKDMPLKILCGYRVKVTLRPQAQDGKTPIEMGVFSRRFELRSSEEGVEPVQFLVFGTLQGPVTVGLPDDQGRIMFNAFRRDRGTKKDNIPLLSDVKGLKLEVDQTHTSAFLEAKLGPPQSFPDGRQEWKLSVRVLPGKANGNFPRQDDPAFRDSAVYVKIIDGEQTRSIRIPVQGEAQDP